MLVELERSFEFARRWYRGEPVRALALQYYFVLRSVLAGRPELRRYLARCRHCRIFFLTDPRNAGREDLGCPFGCAHAHRQRRSSERSTAYNRTASGKAKRRRRQEEERHTTGRPESRCVAEAATCGGRRGEETPAAPPARAGEAPGGGRASGGCEEAPSDPAEEGGARLPAAPELREEGGERPGVYGRSQSQEERHDRSSPSPAVHPGNEGSRAQSEEGALEAGIVEYVRVVVSLIEERRVKREEVLEMLRRTRRQHSLVRERRIHYVVRSLDEDPP